MLNLKLTGLIRCAKAKMGIVRGNRFVLPTDNDHLSPLLETDQHRLYPRLPQIEAQGEGQRGEREAGWQAQAGHPFRAGHRNPESHGLILPGCRGHPALGWQHRSTGPWYHSQAAQSDSLAVLTRIVMGFRGTARRADAIGRTDVTRRIMIRPDTRPSGCVRLQCRLRTRLGQPLRMGL